MGSVLHRSVNRPEPNELAYWDRSDNLNVNTDLPYQAEVETAIQAMKDGKARGVYCLQAELLKEDTTTAFLVPNNLFAKIWNHEVILENKSVDHVLKIRKKGDLGNCDSWDALLSIRILSNVRAKLR